MEIVDGYWKAVALWRLGWLMIGVAFDGASFGAVVIAVGVGQARIGRCFLLSVAQAIAVGDDWVASYSASFVYGAVVPADDVAVAVIQR